MNLHDELWQEIEKELDKIMLEFGYEDAITPVKAFLRQKLNEAYKQGAKDTI